MYKLTHLCEINRLNSFELIFNINSNEKFDNLELNLPKDFNIAILRIWKNYLKT